MGTKNNPGEFDCYANAEDDEPMFVLLARDAKAPELVRRWAHLRHLEKVAAGERLLVDGHDEKELEAMKCADAMEQWQAEHD